MRGCRNDGPVDTLRLYASRRSVLWPRVFGFHELFHLVVIAANAVFYLVILQQCGAGPPT